MDVTPRMMEALAVLATAPKDGWTPSAFAARLWPGKAWGRSNGPWGLGPDASGRHGGRMLTRLSDAGLARLHYPKNGDDGYYLASITKRGRELLHHQSTDQETDEESAALVDRNLRAMGSEGLQSTDQEAK